MSNGNNYLGHKAKPENCSITQNKIKHRHKVSQIEVRLFYTTVPEKLTDSGSFSLCERPKAQKKLPQPFSLLPEMSEPLKWLLCCFALHLISLTLTPHQSALRRKLPIGLHPMDYCLQYEQTKDKALKINSFSKHSHCNKVPLTFSHSPILVLVSPPLSH